jgi:hypothetical protein
MSLDASEPKTFLFHDGELADVRSLLQELGADFCERTGGLTPEDRRTPWDLAIATPKRMLDFGVPESGAKPVRIAVLAAESQTLLKMLQRQRVEFVVRRPVDPAALRLLILHALYRGPEKRGVARATIGAPIRFRSDWRWQRAILADLSPGGCRLVSSHSARRGERITLKLPATLTGGTPLSLIGRVVGLQTLHPGRSGSDAIEVCFEALSKAEADGLEATLASFGSGSDPLPGSTAKRFSSGDAAPTHGEDAAGATDGPDATTEEPVKRRGVRGDRRGYSRRVIALGDEVARVLIGRDLSIGGMRVDPIPALSVGDTLRIAIHVRAGETPLVVSAVVCRDDGDRGLALQFRDFEKDSRHYLSRMLEFLPCIEAQDENDEGESVVVSEILDRVSS